MRSSSARRIAAAGVRRAGVEVEGGVSQSRRKYPRTLFEASEVPTPQHDRIVRWLNDELSERLAEKESSELPDWLLRSAGSLKAEALNCTMTCFGKVQAMIRRMERENGPSAALREILSFAPSPEQCVDLPPAGEGSAVIWEKAVVAPDGFVVGFVDVWTEYTETIALEIRKHKFFDFDDLEFATIEPVTRKIKNGYEVKPRIESVGSVIRQIRFYETYLKADKYTVVAPEASYREDFEYQGIGFMAIPPEVLSGAWG